MKKTVLVFVLVVIMIAALLLFPYLREVGIRSRCSRQNSADLALIAGLEGDDSGCKALSEPDRSSCIAWAMRNPDACQGDAVCAAIAVQNPDECPGDDAWCRAVASASPGECIGPGMVDDSDISECRAWAARDKGFFSVQGCIDSERALKAGMTGSPSWCEKISNAAQKEQCIRDSEGPAALP